jgi:hypothetical protein
MPAEKDSGWHGTTTDQEGSEMIIGRASEGFIFFLTSKQ